jgi:hypothetical protein
MMGWDNNAWFIQLQSTKNLQRKKHNEKNNELLVVQGKNMVCTTRKSEEFCGFRSDNQSWLMNKLSTVRCLKKKELSKKNCLTIMANNT